ncbi:MAG: DUF1730 domain-containing protein [Clostridiales bacterium]|jgi:epoxyqueuosine reductase QueG|nr:DUF1730 domain-containing protein [Clostridiales bacterium]
MSSDPETQAFCESAFKDFMKANGVLISACDALPVTGALERHGHRDIPFAKKPVEERLDPSHFLKNAKSVICLIAPYGKPQLPEAKSGGLVSAMAACEDYHARIKGLLLELARMIQEKISFKYKIFVDSGLLMEKEWCVKTGLAFWGKNCLAVSPLKGSFFNIGLMVVDFEIAFKADGAFGDEAQDDMANQAQDDMAGQEQDDIANKSQTQADLDKKTQTQADLDKKPQTPAPNPAPRLSGGCGECRLCVDACPSKAINSSGYVLDHAKCVSYLTQKQALENSEQALLKGWLHGCDVCQAVCPYNKQGGAWTAKPAVVSLDWAMSLDEAQYKEAFGNTSAGWKPLELLKRNAQTAKERQERQERRFASE